VTPAASAATAPAVKRGADRRAGGARPGPSPGRGRPRADPRVRPRTSGATRGARRGHWAHATLEGAEAVALRLGRAMASLSRHRVLERVIGGRTWIAFVAFALIGIVTMQLGLLKLNSGIGRALEHEALLQRENATLSIEDSELASGNTVRSRAARIGMELAPLSGLLFLAVRPGVDPARAATALETSAQSAAGSSEASATAASASSEAAAGSAPSESGSAGSASESSAAGAPAATNRQSEATSSSSLEASARSAPGASTPSSAEGQASSGPPGAGGGEAASGGGTSASASGG